MLVDNCHISMLYRGFRSQPPVCLYTNNAQMQSVQAIPRSAHSPRPARQHQQEDRLQSRHLRLVERPAVLVLQSTNFHASNSSSTVSRTLGAL